MTKPEPDLTAFFEGLRALSEPLELDDVLNKLVEQSCNLFQADRCGIYLLDEEGTLTCPASRGLSSEYLEAVSGHSPWPAEVQKKPQPVFIADALAEPDLSQLREAIEREGVHSILFLPLFRKHLLGKLALYHDRPHRWEAEEVELAQALADHAAVAIEQAQLRRAHRRFLEIGTQLISATELSPILQGVVKALVDHSPFRVAAISVFSRPAPLDDPKPPEIAEVYIAGLAPEQEQHLRELARSRRLVSNRLIVTQGRRIGQAYFLTPEEVPEIAKLGVPAKSAPAAAKDWREYDTLCYLFTWEDQTLGRVTLADPAHGRVPTPEELSPLEVFVNLATMAVQKARHLHQTQSYRERLEGIYRLSEHLAGLESLEALIEEAMEIIIENFAYDHGTLFLLEGDELVLKGYHTTTLPQEEIQFDNFRRFSIDRGVCGWVACHKQPVLVGDVRQDPRYVLGHPDIRSELAVPIMEEDEVLGVLNIENVKKNAFTQEDLELLQALARQLGVAIRNLRRREQLSEALKEREWRNRFLQGLNESRDLEELLRMILERAIELLAPKANAGNVVLYNEAKGLYEFRVAINRDLEKLRKVPYREEDLLEVLKSDGPVLLTRSIQREHPEFRRVSEETGEPIPGSTISLPVRDPETERLIAFVNINNLEEEGVFTEEDAQKLWALVPEITAALSRARDRERLRELATHDALTNTYNRHYFTEFIQQEQERAKRYGHPISLVMVDIDDFYAINDRFGHAEGDRILREVAKILMDHVRAPDTVIRYGGDEFLIVMPQTAQHEAERAMERLHKKMESWDCRLPGLRLSISFGVASWTPGEKETLEQVLERADEFMYHRRQALPSARRARKRATVASSAVEHTTNRPEKPSKR